MRCSNPPHNSTPLSSDPTHPPVVGAPPEELEDLFESNDFDEITIEGSNDGLSSKVRRFAMGPRLNAAFFDVHLYFVVWVADDGVPTFTY